MSKTIASTLCETNQIPGLPQENVFMQNLYRLPSDYSASFQRSATSTAPVQICAVVSAQADDTIGAMALQEVMKILAGMTAQAQTNSVLNFEVFINEFLQTANYAVCNLSVSNHGAPVRVSITMLIIEGDTMRIVSVGNTRAVLVHQGRVIALSEDQTVAHRYVQMGAIPADAENSHPERSVLTQYIGRFPQDGPIIPEKQIYMKLTDGDEICLLGTGITQGLSDYSRNTVLVQSALPEQKALELVGRSISNNVKGGLTVLLLRIENTLLMPVTSFRPGASTSLAAAGVVAGVTSTAGAVSAAATAAASEVPVILGAPVSENRATASESPYDRAAAAKRAKILAIVRPIAVFLGCILAGYLGVMLIFNIGNIIKPSSTPATNVNGSAATLSKVMYVLVDNTPLYSDASLDKEPIAYLNRGDVVTTGEVSGSFSRVQTIDSVNGYIISAMLSDTDPTHGEAIPDMSADPTPIPSKEQTAVTTSGATENATSETAAPTESAVVTSEPTPAPSETSATPTPSVVTSTPTPAAVTSTPTPPVTETPTNTPTAIPTGSPTNTPADVPTISPTPLA